MDARDQARLESLKREQSELRLRLDHLEQRIRDLERDLSADAQESLQVIAPQAQPQLQPVAPPTPPPLPPVTPAKPRASAETVSAECPACHRIANYPRTLMGNTVRCWACGGLFPLSVQAPPSPATTSVQIRSTPAPERLETSLQGADVTEHAEARAPNAPPATAKPQDDSTFAHPVAETADTAAPKPSWEMQLGTHWFVRVGAIVILTGLVFLANHAYQRWIFATTPGVKVTLLYLLSLGLGGMGWFFQRWQEQLRRYGQVLMATGLAAVYFTTYAAHYFANLRVIESPALAGSLLLAIAGFVVWLADRKKSEPLALFAISLACYTSVINDIGLFTLFSNLALTLAAVFFLIRNRWAALSFASLVATYGAFVYWRFHEGGRWLWRPALDAEQFWLGAFFLTGYWVAFTAPVFLSKHEQFIGGRRASFLCLNNGAYFALVGWTLPMAYPGTFWRFALGFGGVLLLLAWLAQRNLQADPVARDACLTKGLILVTVGFLAHYTGPRLSLILAAQSVVLIVMGCLTNQRILRVGSYVVAALAGLLALDDFRPFDPTAMLMGLGVGAFLVFDGWWVDWRREGEAIRGGFSPRVAFFIGMGLFVWFLAAWHNTAAQFRAPLYAGLALVFTTTWYALRLRELTLFGQGFLFVAHLLWLTHPAGAQPQWPWWNPVVVIAVTLALGHWWQHQRSLAFGEDARRAAQAALALAVVIVLFAWLQPLVHRTTWLWLTGALAVGLTGYGVATRAWFIAGCGQLFLVLSAAQFFHQIVTGHPSWFVALAPIAALAGLALVALAVLKEQESPTAEAASAVERISLFYRIAAVPMSICWIMEYIPSRERFWVFAACGLALLLWAARVRRTEVFWFSGAFTLTGFGHYWLRSGDAGMVYLPNALAILALALQQQLARKRDASQRVPSAVHTVAIALVSATLWLFLTRWVQQAGSGFYHTAAWAALAFLLFVVGLPLRESAYRRCGMGLLGLALLRVTFVDIWKLDALYKIVSCIGLGVVLLVLGFIYNKFQEQIRKWL